MMQIRCVRVKEEKRTTDENKINTRDPNFHVSRQRQTDLWWNYAFDVI